MSFRERLWEGTALIYDRYSEGKALSKDLVAILTARVAAEERYAKELAAIAARVNTLEDTSSLPSAWKSIRDSHAQLAEAHTVLAKDLQSKVIKVVSDDINKRSTEKGALFEEDKSLHAQLAKHKAATEAALQRYFSCSAAAEASRKQFHFAQQDASTPPKKLKTMETQEAKLTGDAEKAHEAYKTALQELNAFQKQFETGLGTLLDKLQRLDEERTVLVHNVLKVYMEEHAQLHEAEHQLNEKNASAVGAVDAPKDLQGWIAEHANGLQPEPLTQYEEYESQFDNATPDDVPNPSKLRGVFATKSLRKPGAAGGAAPPPPSQEDKKLKRQKSLSRLLGSKSKGVSKKEPSSSPVSSSPQMQKKSTPSSGSSSPSPSPSVQTKSGGDKGPAAAGKGAGATLGTSTAAASPSSGSGGAAGQAKKAKSGRKAKAMFEFAASDETEISFAVGDIITVVRVDDSGWWDCDRDGEVGLAPGNYLEFIEDEPSPRGSGAQASSPPEDGDEDESAEHAAPATTPVVTAAAAAAASTADQRSTSVSGKDSVDEGAGSVEQGDEEDPEPIGYVVALYDFAGDGEDELPIKVGEKIAVFAEVEGWYSGTNESGRYGLLPKNFTSPMRQTREEL